MDPQSLDLQGFPEARVEMKVAPFRALTHLFSCKTRCCVLRRNEGRPIQGIETDLPYIFFYIYNRRNEGRPIQGIDTFFLPFSVVKSRVCRNEGRPFQGIDTNLRHYSFAQIYENS